MRSKLFILTLWLFLGLSGPRFLFAQPSKEPLSVAHAAMSPPVLDKPLSTELKLKEFVFPAELAKADIYLARIELTFQRSFIQSHHETVRRSVRALVRATGYLFSPANKAGVIETMVKRLGIQSQAVAASTYDAFLQTIDQKPYPSMHGLENIQRLLGRLNPDVARVPLGGVVDMSFMEELENSGFIDAALRTGGRAP